MPLRKRHSCQANSFNKANIPVSGLVAGGMGATGAAGTIFKVPALSISGAAVEGYNGGVFVNSTFSSGVKVCCNEAGNEI